jgi:ribosome recycling factor
VGADALLKATRVDGVYSADPFDNPEAERYDTTKTGEESMYDEILLETEDRMDKAVEHLVTEYRGIRSGRATPGLVENIRVDYYGSMQPLKATASIAIPEPRMVMIKPFDPGSIKAIEKAIQASDLGISPQSDGKLIRLEIPPLSEERRRQIAALIKDKAEECRIAIRNVRRDANREADKAEKDKVISEDQLHDLKDEVQELTKKHEQTVEDHLTRKTKEIMEV